MRSPWLTFDIKCMFGIQFNSTFWKRGWKPVSWSWLLFKWTLTLISIALFFATLQFLYFRLSKKLYIFASLCYRTYIDWRDEERFLFCRKSLLLFSTFCNFWWMFMCLPFYHVYYVDIVVHIASFIFLQDLLFFITIQ